MSRYAQVAFTDGVRRQQEQRGSARAYTAHLNGDGSPDLLGPDEAAFIAARDSFYLASIGESGWPYIQHRGGPPGFLHVLDELTLAFLDVRGNRQYVSSGNVAADDRVSLILMDYPMQRRLKVFGHARFEDLDAHPELAARLAEPRTDGRPEQLVTIRIEGFSWNCPQHITPRFTVAELERAGALGRV